MVYSRPAGTVNPFRLIPCRESEFPEEGNGAGLSHPAPLSPSGWTGTDHPARQFSPCRRRRPGQRGPASSPSPNALKGPGPPERDPRFWPGPVYRRPPMVYGACPGPEGRLSVRDGKSPGLPGLQQRPEVSWRHLGRRPNEAGRKPPDGILPDSLRNSKEGDQEALYEEKGAISNRLHAGGDRDGPDMPDVQ